MRRLFSDIVTFIHQIPDYVELLGILFFENIFFYFKHTMVVEEIPETIRVHAIRETHPDGDLIIGSSFISDGEGEKGDNRSIQQHGASSYFSIRRNEEYFEKEIRNDDASYLIEYTYVYDIKSGCYINIELKDIYIVHEEADTVSMYDDVLTLCNLRKDDAVDFKHIIREEKKTRRKYA